MNPESINRDLYALLKQLFARKEQRSERAPRTIRSLADIANLGEEDSIEWAEIQRWIEENGVTDEEFKVTLVAQSNPRFYEMWCVSAEMAKRLGRKNKKTSGPTGPREFTILRRSAMMLLKKKQGASGEEACERLNRMNVPLPSRRLQKIYKGGWVQWFMHDPKAFHKRWSADLKRGLPQIYSGRQTSFSSRQN